MDDKTSLSTLFDFVVHLLTAGREHSEDVSPVLAKCTSLLGVVCLFLVFRRILCSSLPFAADERLRSCVLKSCRLGWILLSWSVGGHTGVCRWQASVGVQFEQCDERSKCVRGAVAVESVSLSEDDAASTND